MVVAEVTAADFLKVNALANPINGPAGSST